MQDEVHLVANGSTTNDALVGKKDIKGEASENGRDEHFVSVGKERDDLHQISAVEIHNILQSDNDSVVKDRVFLRN